ncbi:Ground-like domain-containing protein [Aphelenchoides besseyi]|nr:Ground-like domain-containing protein [Aphelenchoides besseyi]KAI6200368.1 Ground-like domain-containing protein [Aphelenchoides besseyi]
MFLRYLILATVIFEVVYSGACGCGLPPMPPPPPPCPIQMPTFCPPVPICPPPPPPPPPPMPCPPPQMPVCPPILPPPCPMPQIPMMPTYVSPPSNDCCCQCQSSCKYRGRARTHGSRIFSALTTVEEDPTCNSEKLRAIIEENITDDPTISKRAIQAAAEEKLFAKINVICGREDFSYLVYTEHFCQATVGELTCYAFRMPSSSSISTTVFHYWFC